MKLPERWNEIIGHDLGNDGDPVVCVKPLYGAPDAGWYFLLFEDSLSRY